MANFRNAENIWVAKVQHSHETDFQDFKIYGEEEPAKNAIDQTSVSVKKQEEALSLVLVKICESKR